jgi:hypothetical protein
VSSPEIKNIPLHNSGNQNYNSARPVPIEGRIMIVTTRGARDAVDAFVQARFLRVDE